MGKADGIPLLATAFPLGNGPFEALLATFPGGNGPERRRRGSFPGAPRRSPWGMRGEGVGKGPSLASGAASG
jgi:hypothetical protein